MVMVRDLEPLKFLCSYGRGGKILPRSTDGKLRYVGGLTRVLSVDRSISFSELMVKLKDLCGFSVTLRCQLPNGDIETLISIKSNDEFANLLEEYDRAKASSTSKMVRAFLTPPAASIKQVPASKQSYYFTTVDHHSSYRPSSRPLFGYPAVSGKECATIGVMRGRNIERLKFLCSYGRGGKILPRSTDGKLRYVGGLTRVLSVDRSISFSELMVKLKDFCGFSVTLRCQLPNGDLETIISIKSDDELADLLEEYDRANASSASKMVRAILTPPAASNKQVPSSKQPYYFTAVDHHSGSRPSRPSFGSPAISGRVCYYPGCMQGNPRSFYSGHPRHNIETKSSRFYPTLYSY